MKKIQLFAITIFLGIFVLLPKAFASGYPIAELGNCRDQQECFYYCEIPAHTPACWSYGKYVLHKNVLGEASSSAQQTPTHNITFPIAELGNCASMQACKQFCSLPDNHQACMNFAKTHGMTKQTSSTAYGINKEKFLADAKMQLGCDGADACRAFCSNPTNRQKCEAFAQFEGLKRPDTANKPFPPGLFEATKQALGCDSATTCKQVCSQPENSDKCRKFAIEHHFSKNESISKTPPLSITPPCTNATSCMEWCKTNPELCQQFKSRHSEFRHSQDSGITNPGVFPQGCTTTNECFARCKEHPELCPGFPQNTTSTLSQPAPSVQP